MGYIIVRPEWSTYGYCILVEAHRERGDPLGSVYYIYVVVRHGERVYYGRTEDEARTVIEDLIADDS